MGSNFHTPWVDDPETGTLVKASSMNPALAALDKGITYLKNVIVHFDGNVTYNPATGQLTWDDVIRILFIREDGQAIQNTVNAGNITLADNEFAYVDLNEINDTVLTMGKAAVTTGAASNFKAVNRLVFGYRNTASDEFFAVMLKQKWTALSNTFLGLTDTPGSFSGQKGKISLVNSGETALEFTDYLKRLADVRILWDSVTQISLNGLAGTSKRIYVNGEYVDISTPKTVTTAVNKLAADGTDSGSTPGANETGYIYQSNSQASWRASSLGLSTVAPAGDGYLAASGNGSHWRHVGWYRTDASGEFTGEQNVISAFNGRVMTLGNSLTSGTFSPSVGDTFEDTGISESFLWPPGWSLNIDFTGVCHHDAVNKNMQIRVKLIQTNDVTMGSFYESAGAGIDIAISGNKTWRNGTSLLWEEARVQFWSNKNGGNGTLYLSNAYTDAIITLFPGGHS